MDTTLLTLFVLTFSPAVLLPGPNAAFAVAQTLKYGARKSIFAALGFMTATGIHVLAVLSGLGYLAQKHLDLFIALKWVGVIYLLCLAIKMFTVLGAAIDAEHKDLSPARMFTHAVFISCTNPKAITVSIILFPLFINMAKPYLTQAISIGGIAMIISFCVYYGYVLIAQKAGTFFKRATVLNKFVGSLYVGVAGALAASG